MTVGSDTVWALLGGAGAALLATPAAIAIAQRTEFFDHPVGYKKHSAPTPYLGGAAVLCALCVVVIALGLTGSGFGTLLGCALLLWLIGTIDDRVAVAPVWRLLAETAIAVFLYEHGLGWNLTHTVPADLILTVVWVVGVVNALNLMDNLDGAAATVAGVAAGGIAGLALVDGAAGVAGPALALAGACAGFLCFNLSHPRARIFLGDGGSMPIGLLVAGLAMTASKEAHEHAAALLGAALLVGLPILDVTLVSLSRWRRGVPLVTGGRDHLTHRLLLRLGTPRAVAGTLAVLQACLCGLAIAGDRLGVAGLAALAGVSVALGVIAIVVLESAYWRPAGMAVGSRRRRSQAVAAELEPLHVESR
jgi:UDP-GlcNAc:undecaprenyl-phosphate/decaprenyl-phosphate GlcNAc-1-phosphate transferase